jgi:AraC family L-rhamnose operon transcriptional activator RhaR
MPRRPPDTDLALRYRFERHIAPLADGVPVWTARARFDGPVPLHDHDFLEIEVVEAGTAEHRTIHACERVGPGRITILHPGHWHGYERPRGLVLRDIYCDPRLFARELAWMAQDARLAPLVPMPMVSSDRERRRVPQGIISWPADARLLARVRRLAAAIARAGARKPLPRAALLGHVLALLDLLADQPPVRALAARGVDPQVSAALSALMGDLAFPWTMGALAAHVGLSASQLVRRMRRSMGQSPLRWLNRARAERLALLLLRDGRPVRELSPQVGWHEPSYAARRFHAAMGMTPSDFRRQRAPVPHVERQAPIVRT